MTERPVQGDEAGAAPGGPTAPRAQASMRTMWLIALVALAPLVASYAAYYFFPRQARVNYGTLRLPTKPFPEVSGTLADGASFRLGDLRGRWVLVLTAPRGCDSSCERNLYAGRQARTMQGRERDRIVRVLLVAGALPPAPLVAEHAELVVVRVSEAQIAALPGDAGSLQLVDPLGNRVLDYPADPDIKGIAADLTRLLKASGVG